MLRIRLLKPGKSVKRTHHFKMVVIEGERARDSKFIEQIGLYDPARNLLNVDCAAYEKWVKKGAQPTVTVKKLYQQTKKTAKV